MLSSDSVDHLQFLQWTVNFAVMVWRWTKTCFIYNLVVLINTPSVDIH